MSVKWIEENQHPEDFHVILKEGKEDYAYMDLCPVTAIVDGCSSQFMGVGNVCSKTKGLGHGGILVTLVNDYLKENNISGLLFCRERVVHFYEHYNWNVIPANNVTIEGGRHEGVLTMCYNAPSFKIIEYFDRDF